MNRSTLMDRRFLQNITRIGLPIVLQTLIFNGLALVDNILIGGLGTVPIAAIGVANRLGFVYALFLFGVHSGANMFGAQFWGKRDLEGIRKVLGISMLAGLFASALFFSIAQFFAESFLQFFINDDEVVEQGASFLRIVSFSYFFQSITSAFAIQSRGIGRTRPPLVSSAIALVFNTVLGYVLIYGKFGFPKLGIQGAGYALLLARIIEMSLLVFIIYKNKYELAASFKEMMKVDVLFLKKFAKPVIPVIANELFWALGVSMYMFFYGKMGRSATATAQIMDVLNGLFFAVFIGFGNACGTLIGNSIGAGNDDEARLDAKRSIVLGTIGAVIMGVLLYFSAPLFLQFFHVGDDIMASCRMATLVYAIYMPAKVLNMVIVVGICRSGGDTVFAAIIDALTPWLIGIPMAALAVYVLHLPFHLVLAMVFFEDVVKSILGVWRVKSGKWLHNLIRDNPTVPVE